MSNEGQPMVSLRLTLAQAKAVSTALELITRMGLGQLPYLAELVPAVVVPRSQDSLSFEQQLQLQRRLAALLQQGAAELGHPAGGSFGITSDQLPLEVRRAYEVNCVLDQALAQHELPAAEWRGPKCRGLSFRVTADALPVAVIEGSA